MRSSVADRSKRASSAHGNIDAFHLEPLATCSTIELLQSMMMDVKCMN